MGNVAVVRMIDNAAVVSISGWEGLYDFCCLRIDINPPFEYWKTDFSVNSLQRI